MPSVFAPTRRGGSSKHLQLHPPRVPSDGVSTVRGRECGDGERRAARGACQLGSFNEGATINVSVKARPAFGHLLRIVWLTALLQAPAATLAAGTRPGGRAEAVKSSIT